MSETEKVNEHLKHLLTEAVEVLESAQGRLMMVEKRRLLELKMYIDRSNIMKFDTSGDEEITN